MNNNYLNLHILNSLAFANPNRDDAGAPKTAFYGGVERARMSSQSLKRAARAGFETAVGAPTVRTSEVANLVEQQLVNTGVGPFDEQKWALVDQAIRTLVESDPKPKARTSDDGDDEPDESGDTLMWVAPSEVGALAQALRPHLEDGGKLAGGKKLAAKDLREIRLEVSQAVTEPSMSIAAFGRMFANSVDNAVDAAVQVAHALSTHPHVIEVDYFTAVDDLQAHGAGHIGLNMFTGAVYYRHICIDRAQLAANLDGRLSELDEEVRLLVHALCVELPTGKQTTTAHQSLPSVVLAVEGSRPANLAEAFEAPVSSSDGYLIPSVEALAGHFGEMREFAPSVFGRGWVAGRGELTTHFDGLESVDLDGIASAAASWLLEPAR